MNVGQQDQLFEAIKDLASTLFKYYSELIKQGFTPADAIRLTVGMQQNLMQNTNK